MEQNNQYKPSQMLGITQIVNKNGNGYLFLYPYGAPYADIYAALQELEQLNRANEAIQKEELEKSKLKQEMQDSMAEAQQ